MKTCSSGLLAQLAGDLSTLATLVKITRQDAVVMGFTSHDRDLTIGGVLYSAHNAFQASAVESRAALSTDNMDLIGILDSSFIAEADLRAGLYDHARVDIYLCNWAEPADGVMQLRRGWLGEIQIQENNYHVEVRGLRDYLQRPVGASFTPECRHQFGDGRCGVNLAAHTLTGAVSLVTDRSRFTDVSRSESDGVFNYGLLTWTSGSNNGLSREVKTFISTQITLWLPMPYDIVAGDSYQLIKGCDKRYETCRSTFGNLANFGGFPHLPGVDRLLNYPDSRG